MAKYRGNLMEGRQQAGQITTPPSGHADDVVKGGEVQMRDDIIRSKAEATGTPNKASSKVGTFPGKVFTGRKGGKRGGRQWTAAQAAAVLGKRGR